MNYANLNDRALSSSIPARDEVDLVGLKGEVEARVVHKVLQLDAQNLKGESSQKTVISVD